MKQRTKDYLDRRKARNEMNHPLDLKSFLIAEYNSSRSIIVKKDVKNMIDALDKAGNS